MKYKINEVLHSCYIDEEIGRASYREWVVRTRRGGRFHAVLRDDITWVRVKRGKDQTKMWATSIPDCCRESCTVGERFERLFRTQRQALKHAKAGAVIRRKRVAAATQTSKLQKTVGM